MPAKTQPWHGVYVATALPLNDDLSVDFDAYGEHVAWLAANGVDGMSANGSLGEYQSLSDEDRARVITTAVAACPDGVGVMAGCGAYSSMQSAKWVEQAAEAGATSVLQLPPNIYPANRAGVLEHYRTVASVGLPIVAYNNPHDTKVDLTPDILAELYSEGLIVAVKEFSGDVRRAFELRELAPGLDLIAGTDDNLFELGVNGAVGWIAGYPNALPEASVEMYNLSTSGNSDDWPKALEMYRDLHSLLRWDSKPEFVQAIKLSMDVAGRRGGTCRPPRMPLSAENAAKVTRDTEAALAKGYK